MLDTLGILGNGQLSKMLVEAAGPLALKTLAYDNRLDDEAALGGFFAQARTVVFENEFVDCELLARVGATKAVRFVPALAAIRDLQDKICQKRLLERLGILTAAWLPLGEGEAPEGFLRRVKERFPSGFVLKWARMGYDGKGVLIVGGPGPDAASPEAAGERAKAVAFCAEAVRAGIPLFAEEKIAFRRELAMVSVHSTNGEFASYPLVISMQKAGICRTVQGPATSLGVAVSLEAEAARACEKLARAVQLHGAFALEFFESESGVLLVNEIAPRVHNTGHYTQDCARVSQFENHWRAVLGMPLGDTTASAAFAMVNLIGPLGATRLWLPEAEGPGVLHWYGKLDLRPGRKMGHVNGSAESPEELPALVNALEQRRLKWESSQQ